MNINFDVVKFDKETQTVHISVLTPEPEYTEFLKKLPKRMYQFSTKTNIIPVSSFSEFSVKCAENEYLYSISDDISNDIQVALTKPDYKLEYQPNRGRIILRRQLPTALPLNNPGLTTWTTEGWNFTVATSEAYKIPLELFPYNPKVSYEYTAEVKELITKETEKRSATLSTITATEADEIQDDILFTLRPFQKVAKKFAIQTNKRCILALDMGLGKTPVSISIAESDPTIKKVLIICPAVLKTNWRREIKKAVGLESLSLSGAVPNELSIGQVLLHPKHKYHIINYDIIARGTRDDDGHFVSPWSKLINLAQYDLIIIDEAHYTKNIESGRSKAVRELKSRFAILLTGTPIVNRPAEVWPLLHIIDPKTFSAYESFSGQWLWDNGKTVRNEKAFREMLSSYMFRRRKEDVIADLPKIERFDRFIELSMRAKALYTKALEGVYQSLRNPNFERDINSILTEILRLKQIVADDTVQHTVELAQEIYEETDKKVLIFSQFVQTCHTITSQLPNSLCITGEDDDTTRYQKIDKFQNNPEYKYMVLSTKAGAEGLTLTAAHYIIFNDLMWTPKDHRQAEARCYGRLNDMHTATAYYMQAEGTITEMIMALLRKKMELIESTIEGINKTASEGESIVTDFLKQLRMGLL